MTIGRVDGPTIAELEQVEGFELILEIDVENWERLGLMDLKDELRIAVEVDWRAFESWSIYKYQVAGEDEKAIKASLNRIPIL